MKILVVDDEVDITDSCVGFLNQLGYEAYGARNSKEAFDAIDKYKPDILLVDLNLREKFTGYDVFKKNLEANPRVQAAVMTGLYERDAVADACMRDGAKKVLLKPIPFEKPVESIKEMEKNIK